MLCLNSEQNPRFAFIFLWRDRRMLLNLRSPLLFTNSIKTCESLRRFIAFALFIHHRLLSDAEGDDYCNTDQQYIPIRMYVCIHTLLYWNLLIRTED